MTKISEISIEIKNDLTQFHGLVRKLSQHGFSESQIKAIVANCFWYDVMKNDLANVIDVWHKGRVESILKLNPHLNEEK